MIRAIARKWAAALDSGEYEQTTGQLRDDNGFCCIGVLCNIHAQDNPELAATQTDPHRYFGKGVHAPEEVMGWSGLKVAEGKLPVQIVGARYLTDLNDRVGYTFPEIAKVIRKHWKEL